MSTPASYVTALILFFGLAILGGNAKPVVSNGTNW